MATQHIIACRRALAQKRLKIAFVESASAGKMSYEFSTVPDSGEY